MFGIIKKFFSQKETIKDSLTVATQSTEVNKVSLKFKKIYLEKLKNVKEPEEFHRFAVDLVVQRIKKTDYGKYNEFLSEIKYFIHHILLVVKDDYTYGDKICQKTLTQFDNYIFSAYRKKPELAENIKKISLLAGSKRFTESPKENILSYFVFLEESGIDLVMILKDYTDLLDSKNNPDHTIIKKEEDLNQSNILHYESLHSVVSTNANQSIRPKNLDK